MNLTNHPTLSIQSLFASSTVQNHNLGDEMIDRFGRTFVYVKAGAAALVVGNAIQGPAQNTDHDQLTPAAAAAQATSITVTLGSAALTANEYAGGWAIIDTTPGLGYAYPIDSHPAADASATCVLTLPKDAPIQVALTTSSRVTLTRNPYKGVIQAPVTTLTGPIVGVAVYPIGISEFGWLGKNGTFGTLVAGTPAVGACVVSPGTAAGAVVVDPANAAVTVIGQMQVTGVDGKVLPVKWQL